MNTVIRVRINRIIRKVVKFLFFRVDFLFVVAVVIHLNRFQ